MDCLIRPWGHMHYQLSGPDGVPVILWANSLGTDLRIWDGVVARLPGWRHLRFDKRGHGLSSTPAAPWTVADLADDAAALLGHLRIKRAVVAGCSVGGLIAQAMAIQHQGLVRALVLSNTAAKIGTHEAWAARTNAVRQGGIASILDGVLERWFAPAFRHSDAARPWGTMLLRCDPAGYIGTCDALARADFRADAGRIAVPTLMIAGTEDLATPLSLVAETCAMIPGAQLLTLQGSGHIPAIDAPGAVATAIDQFLKDHLHD
jgi:3-oxoadipate enol-lactonase